jgi:hypothetical protein
MSFKTLSAALLFAWIAISMVFAQAKPDEKPAPPAQDFSKEAYVIEKLNARNAFEEDGGGTRERAAEIRILAEAGVKTFRRSELHLHKRQRSRRYRLCARPQARWHRGQDAGL